MTVTIQWNILPHNGRAPIRRRSNFLLRFMEPDWRIRI